MTEKWEFPSKKKHLIEMPFSHGMEMELQMLDENGQFLKGDDMVFMMKKMVERARDILIQMIDSGEIPKVISNKIVDYPRITYNEEKGDVLTLSYKLNGDPIDIEIFGRDGNVAAITYILECVTPPCIYVEELTWWAQQVLLIAELVLPKELFLISSGFNPLQKEYFRGLTMADHNHMGSFKNDKQKIKVYNMFRNFLPHILALSVNSPLINGSPTDVIKILGKRYACPGCVRSIRLKENDTMLSYNDFRSYIPYMDPDNPNDYDYFLMTVQKASLEDARQQDIFPYTEFNTIETRICDAQTSIARRIGIAMVLQMLALKAIEMKVVPDVGSKLIVKNRVGAISRGLFSVFRTEDANIDAIKDIDEEFADCYFNTEGRLMQNAVQGMLKYIGEGKTMRKLFKTKLNKIPYLDPIIISVYGQLDWADPPVTEAEYQLSLYNYRKADTFQILGDLVYMTHDCIVNPLKSPLEGNPDYPKFWK
ncbi:MAG: hypothetical protein GF329_22475 [Candidatus Lokiarchaeota archaeon]|nr:hypothetical protein [Candidatus Lokiarchaeota archaeon]